MRFHLRLRGTVQGVFFRQSTRVEADRLGLVGFVRNLPNGDVEAVAEGSKEALDAFLTWCRRGPPHAHVQSIDVHQSAGTGEFETFTIRL